MDENTQTDEYINDGVTEQESDGLRSDNSQTEVQNTAVPTQLVDEVTGSQTGIITSGNTGTSSINDDDTDLTEPNETTAIVNNGQYDGPLNSDVNSDIQTPQADVTPQAGESTPAHTDNHTNTVNEQDQLELCRINVNGHLFFIKDDAARDAIADVIASIMSNNSAIGTRINDLNTRLETIEDEKHIRNIDLVVHDGSFADKFDEWYVDESMGDEETGISVVGVNKIFVAEYDVTAYNDITAAITAKKAIFMWNAEDSMALYKYEHTDNEDAYHFVTIRATAGIIKEYKIESDNTWSLVGNIMIVTSSNRVSSWQATPDNNHYPSEKLVKDSLDAKQDMINDLSTIRSGAAAGATAYQKPSGGIPSTDLAQSVQTALSYAKTHIYRIEINSLEELDTDYVFDDSVLTLQMLINDINNGIAPILRFDVLVNGNNAGSIDLYFIMLDQTSGAMMFAWPYTGQFRTLVIANNEEDQLTIVDSVSLSIYADLQTHTSNTDIHVSLSEKNTWNAKQNALTFDNTPTSGSNNPVKSGGIYTSIQTVKGVADTALQPGDNVSVLANDANYVTSFDPNGHAYVDLGLPSGTCWATCNVGATNPEDYGNYYSWGETTVYDNSYSSTKYNNTDGLSKLELSDDVANVSWGGYWKIPSTEQFAELKTECTYERTTINGINGYSITGPNGNSIFLPFAGWYTSNNANVSNVNTYGYYWNNECINSSNAKCDTFIPGWVSVGIERKNGCSIRPVISHADFATKEYVDNKVSIKYQKPIAGIPSTDLKDSKVHVYHVDINADYSGELTANTVLDNTVITTDMLQADITNGMYVIIRLKSTDNYYENYFLSYYDGESDYYFANCDGYYIYQMKLGDDGNGALKVKTAVKEIEVQQKINNNNKLSASYINETTAKKFVSQTEKDTWNAKAATDSTTASGNAQDSVGAAKLASGIPFGVVDSTSTSTAFTATVDGIKSLRDGVCVYLKNNVVDAATGCTLDINGLGAYPIYTSQSSSSATTLFVNGYTMLFVYNTTRGNTAGACWDLYTGYNADVLANRIRRGQSEYKTSTALYRYQILFTKKDGTLLPVNTTSNSTGTSKTLTTTAFNPFGQIWYYVTTTTTSANNVINSAYLYSMYQTVDLRYSFNTGSTLTTYKDVYVVCTPQSDGTVKLYSSPITQDLPTTDDGLVYIRLGKSYNSTTSISLDEYKPVYCYKHGKIQLWTGIDIDKYLFGTNCVSIPSNSDLDNYTTPGVYYAADMATAGTISHTPYTNGAFRLISLSAYNSTDWMQQILISHGGMWIRFTSSRGTFGSWEKLLTSGNVQSKPSVNSVASGTTSLSASLDNYYNISGTVDTLTITLPTVSDTTHINSFVVSLTTGASPNITITPPSGVTVSYYSGFQWAANTEYELNCMFNGNKWIISQATIS